MRVALGVECDTYKMVAEKAGTVFGADFRKFVEDEVKKDASNAAVATSTKRRLSALDMFPLSDKKACRGKQKKT